MTNPKTDHHTSKPTSTPHTAKRAAASAQEKQSHASASMIEASDRLGQKLDDLASLVRKQLEAGRQSAASVATDAPAPERAHAPDERRKLQAASRGGIENSQQQPGVAMLQAGSGEGPGPGVQNKSGGPNAGAPPTDAIGGGTFALADAGRLADTIARARNTSQEQAASMRQALEAIMAHLESQADGATLKVDAADIMSRLQDLEERQQSLQSQFSSNRWGP